MFAVIRTGGKQYKVATADLVAIEKLAGDEGDPVAFAEVLMVGADDGVTVGSPLVAGATVAGEIVGHRRAATILVFKKRRRQNSKRSRGHRQSHTLVRITEILGGGHAPKRAKAAATPKMKPVEAAAPPKGDNLMKLSGVGPAIEKKLHGQGITTFAEIAAWTAEDVARVDAALGFKGRIERDDWIGQAKKLAAGEE